jgi:hypothetical protein
MAGGSYGIVDEKKKADSKREFVPRRTVPITVDRFGQSAERIIFENWLNRNWY